ncbi:hypothetical protein F5Y04DRAFT_247731 [Hypomontagnella monticulosa]|nr:hypothetical protein F5Y04DRAFT_247731 [Hypomontagnella monticulosa]
MRAPPEQICRVVERPPLLDPEDGIMDEVDTMLAERKNDTKVSSWKELWQKLFPSDQAIPPPDFVPPRVVEISEVARAVQGINFEEMLLPLNTTGASSNVQDVHQYLPPQFVPQFIMNLTTELENISADSYMTDQFVGFNPGQLQSDLTLDTYGSSIGGPSSAWGLNYPLNMPSTHSNIETSPAPKRTRFSCDSCNMSFNTTNDLRRHIQAKHPEAADPQYTCQCAYTSTRKDNYNRHIASCKRKRVLDPHCKCGFEASSLTELGEHVKVCKFGYGRARRDRSSTSDPRPAAAEED